jgi:adenylate cyclase
MNLFNEETVLSRSSLPPEDEIRKELALIVASERFVRSPRMKDLFSYLVEESLQGRGNRIKAFTIAQEVFGRDEKFDQQRDTIVRVEAGRLRRRLEEFYTYTGQSHTVRISIPKGGLPRSFTSKKSPAIKQK